MPDITANTLLVRAESWDASSAWAHSGVAHQTVQIRTPRKAIKRAVYWDLQGKRKPRPTILSDAEEKLRSTLGQAGINWEQPLSASAYQAWHDHQHVRSDHIVRSGTHLLTLTTTVPDGDVSEESLTVRDTDFHPVVQKVGFRNSETVEIAELDFAILPWNDVDANAFERVSDARTSIVEPAPRLLPQPQIPAFPSPEQMDETELAARLILNQLHADTGEQIEIRRSQQVVEVHGLVDSNERKYELIAGLRSVPRLRVSIQSAAQLLERSPETNEVVEEQKTSLPDQRSALETYMRARGTNLSDTNLLAECIFGGALTISQESHAIADLQERFSVSEHTPVIARATLEDLLYGHRERLFAALKRERLLLVETGRVSPSERAAADLQEIPLADGAARNLSLAKELTQTNVQATRSAESIVADMYSMVGRMAATLNTSGGSHHDAAQHAKE